MALSTTQRLRILRHVDYALLSTPTTLSLGSPTITQARFIIEQNLLNLDEAAEKLVLTDLERCDRIECQMDQVSQAMIVRKQGETEFRDDALEQLRDRYNDYTGRLTNMLAAQKNPVAQPSIGSGGMGANVIEPC